MKISQQPLPVAESSGPPRKGSEVYCEAPGCENVTKLGSAEWKRSWMRVWIQKAHRSYSVCSMGCGGKLKKESR